VEDANDRRDYYERQGIGYVARPPHGQDNFIRKGRFKKASNMNFALALSLRVEELVADLQTSSPIGLDDPFNDTSLPVYQRALEKAIQESEGKAQAEGDIRV
jgi:hypothetical protein